MKDDWGTNEAHAFKLTTPSPLGGGFLWHLLEGSFVNNGVYFKAVAAFLATGIQAAQVAKGVLRIFPALEGGVDFISYLKHGQGLTPHRALAMGGPAGLEGGPDADFSRYYLADVGLVIGAPVGNINEGCRKGNAWATFNIV